MRRVKLSILATCLLSAGCIPAPKYDREFEAQFNQGDRSAVESFASGYFPESYGDPIVGNCSSDSGPWPLISEVEQEWYPEQWLAAREPSFFMLSEQDPPPKFALRFSYIPSFSPSIFVRVQEDEGAYTLIAKRMDGAGGYEPGSIASSKKVTLSDQEVADLRQLLREDALFEENAEGCSRGFDGSEWLFELVDQKGYRFVKRWSPTEGSGHRLGQHLIALTGWNMGETCLYPFPYPMADVGVLCR